MAPQTEPAKENQRGDLQFPWKLHLLLEQAEQSGEERIISWLPDGRAFRIHDKLAFSEKLMKTFFSSSKFKSFQRSLNLWGFETVSRGPEKGARFHKHFIRGEPDLCRLMTRTKVKGTPKTFQEVAQSDPASDCSPRSMAAYNAAPSAGLPNPFNGSSVPLGNIGTPLGTLIQQYDLSRILSQASVMNSTQGMSVGVRNNANPAASLDQIMAVSRSLIAAQNNVDSFQRASAADILNSRAAIQRGYPSATSNLPIGPQVLNASAIVNFVANQILAQESSRQLMGDNSSRSATRPALQGGDGQGATTNVYGV
jgi:hypothetical protein